MSSVIHVDADAFFASVEQAADPRLRGKPIAVGGEKRGIIASASYEARRYGIYTPMPTVQARRLCPQLVLLPGDFEKYERFSRWMFSYAYDFTPTVEICSIDEGYFDLSGSRKRPREVAETVRKAIYDGLKISVSEGIGSNKLVSQIASKLRKPAALIDVPSGRETAFLHPLPHGWLPGIGPHTARRMNAAGLHTIGQVAITELDCLALLLGSAAPSIREFANGIDTRPVQPASAPARSYGKQHTFDEDTIHEALVEATLRRMLDALMPAVRTDGKLIRTITVKVRYNDRTEHQRSESLNEPTDLETDLYGRLRPMLRQAWHRRVSLRMVSVKLSNIYTDSVQALLPLETNSQTYDARKRLATAIDSLRHAGGRTRILRGHDLLLENPTRYLAEPPETRNLKPASPDPECNSQVSGSGALDAPIPIPLHIHSHYSFLDSTLSPQAIVELAVQHEFSAIALTDHGNLHGAVPFFQAAHAAGIRPILGSELCIDGLPLLLYVENQQGYATLCRLLSDRQAPPSPTPVSGSGSQGSGRISTFRALEDVSRTWKSGFSGLLAVGADPRLARLFPDAFYLGAGHPKALCRFAGSHLPGVAVPAIHYATPADRKRYDIVQSIRTLTLLGQPHPDKRTGAHPMFSSAAFRERFPHEDRLLDHTREIAERCRFSFCFGKLQFPAYRPPGGLSSQAFLRELVLHGLTERYGARAPEVRSQIEEELAMIHEVGYEEYFLVVWDLLQDCRARGIDWITRGSAADSLVCYCLRISDVCPIRFGLYFRRFLNRERMLMNKLPDIDIDFPHDRKDDVVDLLFATYGPEHTAVVGGFSTYRGRSALGDVCKVLGVSEYQARQITKTIPHLNARDLPEAGSHVQCADLPLREEPYATALEMARFLDGVPHNRKMHPCGVVLSRQPMHELTPCFTSAKHYPTTHFDMDAVEDIGLVKIDILAQGGLAVMRDAMNEIRDAKPVHRVPNVETQGAGVRAPGSLSPVFLPTTFDDPAVWDLIAGGQARAVHHIESPAMISLCRMCDVRDIDTLIAVVSVIRPGAANQQKKKHFTLRYQGLEPITYPHPSLEPCLRCSFGMLVYEEQVLQICAAFAGMPSGEADQLRRALNKRDWDRIQELGQRFYSCARERERTIDDIRAVWKLLCGFNGYAFCKAHSTAYGVEAYQAAWLKTYHPAAFMAAVLTHGKGFYPTLVYIFECYRLGITLLPPRATDPGPGFQVVQKPETGDLKPEDGVPMGGTPVSGLRSHSSVRVPISGIKGLSQATGQAILREHQHAPFVSLQDFHQRVAPSREDCELLLRAGAFDDLDPSRTALFWQIQWLSRAFQHGPVSLFQDPADHPTPGGSLTEPTLLERLHAEHDLLGFTVSGHPLDRYPDIPWETYCPIADLHRHVGRRVTCCGLAVIDRVVYHDDGRTMKFITLADRTGMVESQLFAHAYKKYGLATIRYPVLEVTATVEAFDNHKGYTLNIHHAGKPRSS